MSDAAAAPAAAPAASSAPSSAPDTSSAPSTSSTPTEGAAPSSASPGAPPAPAGAAPEPKRYKVKVDGQEMEVPEEELIRGFQTRAAAAKRFEEFAKERKAFEAQQAERKKRLEDPRVVQAAKQWGVDPETAEAVLKVQDLAQREQMSPEARALADERAKREEYERKLREKEEAETKAQQDREVQVHAERLNREVTEAAQAEGLPQVPELGRLMISHMQTMARAGVPFDARESARFAKEQAQGISKAFIGGLSDEALEGFLGKAVVDRILSRSVQRARGQVGAVPSPTPQPTQAQSERKPLSIEEWRQRMAKDPT